MQRPQNDGYREEYFTEAFDCKQPISLDNDHSWFFCYTIEAILFSGTADVFHHQLSIAVSFTHRHGLLWDSSHAGSK